MWKPEGRARPLMFVGSDVTESRYEYIITELTTAFLNGLIGWHETTICSNVSAAAAAVFFELCSTHSPLDVAMTAVIRYIAWLKW